jgi:hypothetical protein
MIVTIPIGMYALLTAETCIRASPMRSDPVNDGLRSPAGRTIRMNVVKVRDRQSRHLVILFLFFIINLMTVALPAWSFAGVPVRAAISLLLLLVLVVVYDRIFVRVLLIHKYLLLLMLGFGIIGAVVSFINFTDPIVVARQIAEIHLQGIVNLILAAIVVEVCGPGPTLAAFLAAILLTVTFAVAQFFDIGLAWDIRGYIGQMQNEIIKKYGFFYDKRPMGLSFSPIALATQLCLAFAAYCVLKEQRARAVLGKNTFRFAIIVAVVLFLMVCIASGNRSPILGAVLFTCLYLARKRPLFFWIAAPLGFAFIALLAPFVMQSLEGSNLRVAEVGDKSSVGRMTLSYYGMRLFLDHPWGYGLDFDPTRYWGAYWMDLYQMPNAEVVQIFPLHNYILSMLNFYGIGILLLTHLIWSNFKIYRWTFLFFTPYIVHILFHNSGPFWNDPLIWIVCAIARGAVGERLSQEISLGLDSEMSREDQL